MLVSNCKYMDINTCGYYDVRNVSRKLILVTTGEKKWLKRLGQMSMCNINLIPTVDVNLMLTVVITKTFPFFPYS